MKNLKVIAKEGISMKKLVKIKLLNWHYIVNETITVKGNTLITGENGSGKSTVLDAIQYVLTAGKPKFNNAANDKASRDIIGYVRCKTGHDSNQYFRTGDVTSHISLEFYDDKKNKSFITGAVIDSASNLSTPKSIFYRIEDIQISEDLFINNFTPRKITDFRSFVKNLNSKVMNTKEEARKDFCHRFGSLNNRFIDLLPKALAFRPINNVKDFVYSYLLDAKDINIDYLKENIKTLTQYEAYLKQVKEKIRRLEEIEILYKELTVIEDNIKIQDYIVKRANNEINELNIKNKISEKELLESNIKVNEYQYNEINVQLNNERNNLRELERALSSNNQFQLLKDLEKQKYDLVNNIKILKDKVNVLTKKINNVFDLIIILHNKNISLHGMEEVMKFKNIELTNENIQSFLSTLTKFTNEIDDYKNKLLEDRAEVKIKKKNEINRLNAINEEINILNSKKLVYPDYLNNLKRSIMKDTLAELGIEIEPKVLCELLYLKDETWQNAVEGYLNTQRFNLIVEPEYFDICLRIYEKIKYRQNIHTIGLVNTKKIAEYETEAESSLAFYVGSQNKHAKNYINMLLNRVTRCENVDDLKKYPISITKTCMVYQNNTARQIKEDVYNKPYIGADAYKKQLEIKLKEKAEVEKNIQTLDLHLENLKSILELLNGFNTSYILNNAFDQIKLTKTNIELLNIENNIKEIDTSSFLELQMKIDELEKLIKKLDEQSKKLYELVADSKANLRTLNINIADLKLAQNELNSIFKESENTILSLLNRAEVRYKEALKDKSLFDVKENYNRQKSGSITRYDKVLIELGNKQRDYNREYHFGAAIGTEGMEAFYNEYNMLKISKVIEFEEKISESKKKAEEQFQDEFISKLQENIYKAQSEFKKLNEALKGIAFGEDEYRFEYYFDKENEKFYKMIMDDENIGGNSLFSTSFREKHKIALEELFTRISIDNDEAKKALDKFTDYRTYMDYDIKIMHKSGLTSSFSKVCREKSGGETQTPYYVAIAASFIQLYNSIQNDSIGLILFDEAFDKMDENRIESMMIFLSKLNLQIILASPPQKIESIAQFVNTTLIVNRDNNLAFVEEFHYEKVQ